jgi:glycosyltransferase involved in cell wall biosynthesis
MTIIFLCRLFSPHIGGVEKHVWEIGTRLSQEGHRLIVITESSSEVYPNGGNPSLFETIDGIEVYRIPVGEDEKAKKWKIWWWMWQQRGLVKKADLIHCHDVFYWYMPLRFLYPFKKIYMTFHGYESYPLKHSAIWMRKIAEKLTKGNICIGDFMKKWYGTKPTYISYGGVTIPKKDEIGNMKVKRETAVFWGRLDDQTGILTYLASESIINKKYAQFSLTVLGEGKLSNKIGHRVKTLAFQKNISEYLNNNQFAFVSRYLSILEALAAKRLVFAVYDNPLKEDYLKMATFAPYIVIEKTPEKLAEKVLFYIENPKLEKEKITAGYEWVRTQTWDNAVNLYKKLWDIE